jgi:hypothetical protein
VVETIASRKLPTQRRLVIELVIAVCCVNNTSWKRSRCGGL